MNTHNLPPWLRHHARLLLVLLALVSLRSLAGPVPVGGISPNFTLTRWNSTQPVRLSDYAGKVVVLDFFAYWCGPCVASSPDVEKNVQEYFDARGGNQNGVPVVVLSVNIEPQNPTATQAFIVNAGSKNVANDYQGVAWSLYNTQNGIPLFVVINGVAASPTHSQWQVLHAGAGYPGADYLRTVINTVQPPPIPKPPTIASHPLDLDAEEGAPASLRVAANGSNPLSYQWFKDGVAVPGANTEQLDIASASASHAGAYRVRVSNSLGSVDSNEARLRVFPATAVTLPDPVLDKAVRQRLGIPTGAISLAAMARLKDLDVTNGTVASLVGLRHATDLQSLRIASAKLANLDGIAGLPALKSLSITQAGAAPDLAALSSLSALSSLALPASTLTKPVILASPGLLTSLSINAMNGSSLDWIRSLDGLATLSVGGIAFADASPIGSLTRLQSLTLGRARSADWAWLRSLQALATLDLNACNLDSTTRIFGGATLTSLTLQNMPGLMVAPLHTPALRNLRMINLSMASIPSPEWLASMPSLYFLDLSTNQIASLAPLLDSGALGRIRYLYASENALEDIEPLRGWDRGWGLDLRGNLLDLNPGTPASDVLESLVPAPAALWTQGQRFPVSTRCTPAAGGRWNLRVTGRPNGRVRVQAGPSLDAMTSSEVFTLPDASAVFQPTSQPAASNASWFFKVTAEAQ